MNSQITQHIQQFNASSIEEQRKLELQLLADYIKKNLQNNQAVRLNFICTHNSRRSHLSQIWAQTMAHYFGIKNIHCYSGGTEETAMFPMVGQTLIQQGFLITQLSDGKNPVYAIKYDENEPAVIAFSKAYHHNFNPKQNFAAILTCNSADEACPIVLGADLRIPIKYGDPKAFDGTPLMQEKYAERSLLIAQEMWYVFSLILV